MMRLLPFLLVWPAVAADLPGSQDPPQMKRYAGSEIIGYRAPKFDEFVLPLGVPSKLDPPAYAKSQKVEGLVSRYTYAAPEGRTPAEVFRNYKLEFQRLNVTPLFEKGPEVRGWFGPMLQSAADEDGLGQILSYNEAQERVLAGKTKDAQPVFYFVFVTAYKDGVIPSRLENVIKKDRTLVNLVVVAPEKMEERMEFVTAAQMAQSLTDTGKVVIYGIHFDTDKDTLRPDSKPTLDEIGRLLASDPQARLHIVGHTDDQGTAEHNLDLSRRRAAAVSRALTEQYGVAATRLDSFGCGLYAPAASNSTDEGRAKNRRVELVKW
ncbi:MAG TPA: OmpA family protein [Bryobacteraceae bacterium]|nr:OmpA family protein [Bryobacteraceae bacterium]